MTYSALIIGVAGWALWSLIPDTDTVPKEEIAFIVDSGIIAGFGEDTTVTNDVEEAAAVAVATTVASVTRDEPILGQPGAQTQLNEIAAEEAANAVTAIAKSTTEQITSEGLEPIPAAVVVQAAVHNLTLEPGSLDDEDSVSAAVEGAVHQAFVEDDTLAALEALTDRERDELEAATGAELTSGIVEESQKARAETVDDLTEPVRDSAEEEVTESLNKGDASVFASVLTALIAPVASIVLGSNRSRPLKLVRAATTSVRYTVTSYCSVEEARVERPVFPFFNSVRHVSVSHNGTTTPFVVAPGHGELELSPDSDSSHRPSWNLRQVWWDLWGEEYGKYYLALKVNGRWHAYPLTFT